MKIEFIDGFMNYEAFQDNARREIARTLRKIADDIQYACKDYGAVMDTNGNKIVSWELV